MQWYQATNEPIEGVYVTQQGGGMVEYRVLGWDAGMDNNNEESNGW
jgi:hypothetical protein